MYCQCPSYPFTLRDWSGGTIVTYEMQRMEQSRATRQGAGCSADRMASPPPAKRTILKRVTAHEIERENSRDSFLHSYLCAVAETSNVAAPASSCALQGGGRLRPRYVLPLAHVDIATNIIKSASIVVSPTTVHLKQCSLRTYSICAVPRGLARMM